MKRCHCPSCRARDTRRFWDIIGAEQWAPTAVVARIGAYGYTPVLNLPPVPTWDGEPREYRP